MIVAEGDSIQLYDANGIIWRGSADGSLNCSTSALVGTFILVTKVETPSRISAKDVMIAGIQNPWRFEVFIDIWNQIDYKLSNLHLSKELRGPIITRVGIQQSRWRRDECWSSSLINIPVIMSREDFNYAAQHSHFKRESRYQSGDRSGHVISIND